LPQRSTKGTKSFAEPFCVSLWLNAYGVVLARVRTIDPVRMNPPNQMKEKKEQLAEEILQYLIDHPNAQDTLKGIVSWWLLERTIKHQTALVKEVLDKLVADGLVIAQQGSDSRTLYKINRRRRKTIISRLQQKS
jgi:hypothetical protein